jgi:hypothetical protein
MEYATSSSRNTATAGCTTLQRARQPPCYSKLPTACILDVWSANKNLRMWLNDFRVTRTNSQFLGCRPSRQNRE